jgi:hypothetical protein
MLTHIVVWKYRHDISEETRHDHRRQIRTLNKIVPGIESFAVGFDVLHGPKSYDTGLVAVFRDRAVLDAYTVHPEHFVKFGDTIIETMAKVDFED